MSNGDGYDYKIHPAADLFPMMTTDELQELAADIAENRLLFPIMLDHGGDILIDGRNRLAACEIAKVKPRFDRLADLAEQVNEERLKIDEALGALCVREEEIRRTVESGRRSARMVASTFGGHVSAIIGGFERDASITITAEDVEMIRTWFGLLLDRVPVSEASDDDRKGD